MLFFCSFSLGTILIQCQISLNAQLLKDIQQNTPSTWYLSAFAHMNFEAFPAFQWKRLVLESRLSYLSNQNYWIPAKTNPFSFSELFLIIHLSIICICVEILGWISENLHARSSYFLSSLSIPAVFTLYSLLPFSVVGHIEFLWYSLSLPVGLSVKKEKSF